MPPVPNEPRDAPLLGLTTRLPEIPAEIGPFKILREIGAGGMGIVFLAQQDKPSRTVALKVVHGSVISHSTLKRFEQEAEVLGRLQHPGIAQIFQVGTYASRGGELPYIAMEFVEGLRLDDYVNTRSPDTRARLELAARIADAVEHAHQKGVIHRDLKPGNILVTADGQPKILDFGLARLSGDDSRTTTLRTDVGAVIGTLMYMSPEQASGDPRAVDKRTDVYSLGVVLFEMLTGKLPYSLERAALPEAVRVIREEEPSKLASHDRALRGDIETIVGKALEKDRTRRYSAAQDLADDIRRSLADEPIQARPPNAWYQLAKFAQRNQILVGGIAAVLLTSLAGAIVATHLYLKERDTNAREREALVAARNEEKRAAQTSKFLLSLFHGISPFVAQGSDTTLLQRILADARGRLATELAGQPDVEAQIHGELGQAYRDLALFDDAEVEFKRAIEIWRSSLDPDDRRLLKTTALLAITSIRRGDFKQAENLLRATLESQKRALGATDPDALFTQASLGDDLMRQGRYREAEELLRPALAEQERLLGPDDDHVLATQVTLAQTLGFESKHEEARELLQTVYDRHKAIHGEDYPETIIALANLAGALRNTGAGKRAIELQREALEKARHFFGEDHQQTLSMLNNLSLTLRDGGKLDEAEDVLRECLERRQRVFGEEHVEALNTMNNLVELLMNRGKAAEYEELASDVLEKTRRVLGGDHKETGRALLNAGVIIGRKGDYAGAAKMFEVIVERNRRVRREDDPAVCLDLYNWAASLQNSGDNPSAEAPLREMIALVEKHGHEAERYVPAARNALAKVLEEKGEHEEADVHFRAALDERRKRFDEPHMEAFVYSLSDYGEALLDRGDFAGAEPLLAEYVEVAAKAPGASDRVKASAHQCYGRCLAKLGRFAQAEEQLLPVCETVSRIADAPPEFARSTRQAILDLYAAWDAAEPSQGIGAKAQRWQAKFPAEQ